MTVSGTNNVGGLVGNIGTNAIITDSYVDNIDVSGTKYVGGFAGITAGDISDSFANTNVEGFEDVGGFVGYIEGTTPTSTENPTYTANISNSYSTGTVTGGYRVGGFAGSSFASYITKSYSTSNVVGKTEVGGFIGEVTSGKITYSFTQGMVDLADGTAANGRFGGFIGAAYGYENNQLYISNVWTTSQVNGTTTNSGGFIGSASGGNDETSYINITDYAFVKQNAETLIHSTGIGVIGANSNLTGDVLNAQKDADWFMDSTNIQGIFGSEDLAWNYHVTSNGAISDKLSECVGVNAITENQAKEAGWTVIKNAADLYALLSASNCELLRNSC